MKVIYKHDPRIKGNESAISVIKWCRKNFGDRGTGWDFALMGNVVNVEIWNEKYQTMWVMWKG